jgi:hypothetical protein
MSRDPRRYLIALAFLSLAGVGGWLLAHRNAGQSLPPGYSFVADIDFWRQTPREGTVVTPYDFHLGSLESIPLDVGDWHGVDVPASPDVAVYLEPEQYVVRYYERGEPGGPVLWLSLIGSRQAKSFHPPPLCYTTWHTDVGSTAIPLDGGDLHALTLVVSQGERRYVMLYFYLWPDAARRFEDGMVMFKVMSEPLGTVEETFDLQREFTQQFFTAAQR